MPSVKIMPNITGLGWCLLEKMDPTRTKKLKRAQAKETTYNLALNLVRLLWNLPNGKQQLE